MQVVVNNVAGKIIGKLTIPISQRIASPAKDLIVQVAANNTMAYVLLRRVLGKNGSATAVLAKRSTGKINARSDCTSCIRSRIAQNNNEN